MQDRAIASGALDSAIRLLDQPLAVQSSGDGEGLRRKVTEQSAYALRATAETFASHVRWLAAVARSAQASEGWR